MWELSGGIAVCASCGGHLRTRRVNGRYPGHAVRYYYLCQKAFTKQGCESTRNHRAELLEQGVREEVSALLRNPDRVARDIEETLAHERARVRDPARRVAELKGRTAGADEERERLVRRYMRGGVPDAMYERLVAELDGRQAADEEELESVRGAAEKVTDLERRKREILEAFGGGLLLGLEYLPPELRQVVYEALNIRVSVFPDGEFEVEGEMDAASLRYCEEVAEYARRLERVGARPPVGESDATAAERYEQVRREVAGEAEEGEADLMELEGILRLGPRHVREESTGRRDARA